MIGFLGKMMGKGGLEHKLKIDPLFASISTFSASGNDVCISKSGNPATLLDDDFLAQLQARYPSATRHEDQNGARPSYMISSKAEVQQFTADFDAYEAQVRQSSPQERL